MPDDGCRALVFDLEGFLRSGRHLRGQYAESWGWGSNLKRGREIIRKLASLTPRELAQLDKAIYQGERVAFYGGPIATTAYTGDVGTEGGFYLRVVTPAGKSIIDPGSVLWDALVYGKILQVFPRNRIIVIEVNEADFRVLLGG
jgi:hypothetical protein